MKTRFFSFPTTPIERTPAILSLLWVFLSANYILCDLLSNMEASTLRGLLEGVVAGIAVSGGFLLIAGLSLEIPILMIVLTVVLGHRASRGVNIGAALLMILYQCGSLFIGTQSPHYLFFSAVEILGNGLVVAIALAWRRT